MNQWEIYEALKGNRVLLEAEILAKECFTWHTHAQYVG